MIEKLNFDGIAESNIHEIEKVHLFEEHGINKQYEYISEELYAEIEKMYREGRAILFDVNTYLYRITNYIPKSETFLHDINIIMSVGKVTVESSFNYREDCDNLTEDGKLTNIIFVFSVISDKNNVKLPDKNEFVLTFCHEYTHAYRYWSIISSNNGDLTDTEKHQINRIKSNNSYTKVYKFDKSSKNDVFFKNINDCIYLTSSDEINAYCSELYEYIKQHTEINPLTFFKVYKTFPQYYVLTKLEDCISMIDDNVDKVSYKFLAKNACESILHFNGITIENAMRRLKQYLAKRHQQFQNQFFKTAKKAFTDLGRYDSITTTAMPFSIRKEMIDILNKGSLL